MLTPIARLLTMAMLLRTEGKTPADHLALWLGIHPRTVARDAHHLSTLGVPIRKARGARGGYELTDSAHLTIELFIEVSATLINAAIARKTPLAHELVALNVPPEERLRVNVLDLMGRLPTGVRTRTFEALESLTQSREQLRGYPAALSHLASIRRALWTCRQLQVRYHRPGQDAQSDIIDAYSLVVRVDAWYVTAYCHQRQDVRAIALAHIEQAQLLDTRFDAPDHTEFLEPGPRGPLGPSHHQR